VGGVGVGWGVCNGGRGALRRLLWPARVRSGEVEGRGREVGFPGWAVWYE